MADRFEKFTERARRVLTLAQEEALRFNHSYIGTEHLLLGLVREGDGVAAKALESLGVELEKVRTAVQIIVGRGDSFVSGEIGLTPRAKKVIELAVDEARRLGHHYIGTDHLLLGLVREDEGIAAGVLESLGVSLDRVRYAVVETLSSAESLGGTQPPGIDLRMMPRREPAQIIDGKAIAEQLRAEVKQRADRLHERGIIPGLALILVGDNSSSLSYVRSKGDSAEQAGIYSDMFHLPETTDEETLISRIMEINRDDRFHAVLVQLPLPKQLREDRVVGAIDPAKDADGQTAVSGGRLLRGEPSPWPATPAGIVEMLHRSGHPPAGKHVVICGRSNIVGKPIAAILMQKSDRANATVTLCHTGTVDLAHYTRQADILIAAMGVPAAITADMVKPGAVVIDVGNNWVEDATRKSGRRLVGDVDYEAVREVAGAITPVPGGVGPMTIAMLLSNTVWLAEQQAGRG
jgi:methylenetetrahydrofolate dehydrogenase (NADP+)/methenyltetrahydrofolate cyclohydrolase